jgi:hypothetical protein
MYCRTNVVYAYCNATMNLGARIEKKCQAKQNMSRHHISSNSTNINSYIIPKLNTSLLRNGHFCSFIWTSEDISSNVNTSTSFDFFFLTHSFQIEGIINSYEVPIVNWMYNWSRFFHLKFGSYNLALFCQNTPFLYKALLTSLLSERNVLEKKSQKMLCRSLFILLFFLFGHFVVCSLISEFWIPLWYP